MNVDATELAAWSIAGALVLFIAVRVRTRHRYSAPETAPEHDPHVTVSALEYNYAVSRLDDSTSLDEIRITERPADVRGAMVLATKLVALRLLSVKDAEVLERNQAKLVIVEGRLVAKAEEDRRVAYLRTHLT